MDKLSQIFNKYLFWLVLGLFIFIPLYPKFPLLNVSGTYVAIRAEDILIALVTICWFIAILPKLKTFLRRTLTQSMLLFWFIGLISLFSGIFITQTVVPHIGFLHFLRRIEVMVLMFISMQAFTNMWQIKLWLKVMLLVTLIIVLYAFGQQWLSFPVISTTNREFSKGLILFLTPGARVNSTFAGHYDLAAYLAFVLTIAAVMLVYFKDKITRISTGIVFILSFIVLTLTAARISFVAALVGIISSFWLIGQKKLIFVIIGLTLIAFVISPELRHRVVATITVNLLGGGGQKYTIPTQKPVLQDASESADQKFSLENAASSSATYSGIPVDIAPGEPINSTELGVYRSFGIRLDVEWPRAIEAFFKNPFLGTGYSSITIATDNDYLRALGETGLLGVLSFGLVWFIIIKKLWLFIKKPKSLSVYLIIGILCVILGVFINSTFIDILESSKVAQLLWLLIGVGLAILKMEEGKNDENS